ncbi:MAG: cysteine synthase family protein [Oscillospiraceae bacterium]|nr:cysteine synthase family protein [Oscillospiraceae bacterium]
MVYDNILEAVGNTPLVKLGKMGAAGDAEVLVKFEATNIGGSIKTRTALAMVEDAERAGRIRPGVSTLVEPSSGNQGVGVALVGAVKGYRVRIVMPDSVSEERRKLVRQYGAEVVLVHDDGDIGKAIDGCIQAVRRMADDDPNTFILQQFENPANPEVHRARTAAEILRQANRPIHGFCAGVGTGGTLTGIGEALRAVYKDILIWAVEPENAAILTGGHIGSHIQMGIGDGLIPTNLNTKLYNDVAIVTDEEAVRTSRELARREGLLCGISSGTNVAAALRMANHLGAGKTVLTILPDTGERYFSTHLFN